MAAPVEIRAATAADAEAVAAIYAAHVLHGTATFDTVPRTAEQTATMIVQFAERGWPFLVAVIEARPVGYAYAAPFRDRPAYAATCENSIYCEAAQCGRGIGTQLLAALLDSSEQAGFRQMIAVIGDATPASIALHARLGFVHSGRLHAVGRKFGKWLDTVYMQRALGPGDQRPPVQEPA